MDNGEKMESFLSTIFLFLLYLLCVVVLYLIVKIELKYKIFDLDKENYLKGTSKLLNYFIYLILIVFFCGKIESNFLFKASYIQLVKMFVFDLEISAFLCLMFYMYRYSLSKIFAVDCFSSKKKIVGEILYKISLFFVSSAIVYFFDVYVFKYRW